MENDSNLLLNFGDDDLPSAKKTKIKGGKWTDRVKANKREKRKIVKSVVAREPQKEAPVKQVIQPSNTISEQTAKTNLKRKRDERTTTELAISNQDPQSEKAIGQVVSSIFDFHDPLPAMIPPTKAVTKKDIHPSNAPLTDASSFAALGILPELITTMTEKLKVTVPTLIQKKTLPILLKTSKDAFIRAQTGSGKTLAYLLPIVNRLCELPPGLQSREKGCYAMIIAPTRELATQIYNVLDNLLNSRKARWMVGVVLIGGEKKKSEKARLRKGCNIVIATPGRLKDHLETTQAFDVSSIRWVVLDEGDRLMDLGFENTIIDILQKVKEREGRRISAPSLPETRVTVICSATAKGDVTKLGEQSLKDAVFIGGEGDTEVAPGQLKQEYLIAPTKLRLVTLLATLKKAFSVPRPHKKVIVFFSCGDTVDWHFRAFSRTDSTSTVSESSFEAIAFAPLISENLKLHKLHGSLSQQTRTATLASFASCSEPAILLCTDVASRGLDLQVGFVVQYDPPFSIDDYVHRIGRTARAGKAGSAIIFLLKSENAYLDVIRTRVSSEANEINVKFMLRSAFGKDFEDGATKWQIEYERWANQSANINQAKIAFSSHVRAYSTHTASEKGCFPIKGLQLGHVAKTFGLRDAPGTIGNVKHTKNNEKDKGKDMAPTDIQVQMRRKILENSKMNEFNVM